MNFQIAGIDPCYRRSSSPDARVLTAAADIDDDARFASSSGSGATAEVHANPRLAARLREPIHAGSEAAFVPPSS